MGQYLQDFENSRLVIYTVIAGNYDTLKDPEFIDENCDYVCFTDSGELASGIWQVRMMEDAGLDSTRHQRMYKVLPHRFLPEYEYSVYVDGNVRITGSLRDFVRNQWKGAPLLGLKHPSRDNVYDEAEACINLGKDDPGIIRRQIARYRSEGYRADNGLTVTNIMFRRHKDKRLVKVMEDWWDEIRENSRRDQLSFCYVCWKNHFEYDVSDLKSYRSEYWMNPGIHTDSIRDVEVELIDHIQQADYHEYLIREKDRCIAQKEQEKAEAVAAKEQEFKRILDSREQEFKNTLALKEQEFDKAISLKDQEFENALTLKEQEKVEALTLKEEEKIRAVAMKEQEKMQAVALKEREKEETLMLKEQELEKMTNELALKTQEIFDLKMRLEHMESTLSWKYTAIFRRIFPKRK